MSEASGIRIDVKGRTLIMTSESLAAGAVARQDHYSNGTVLLSFDVYMNAPTAGESGMLTASVQDGSGPWTASKNVSLPVTGENNATLQVPPVLMS